MLTLLSVAYALLNVADLVITLLLIDHFKSNIEGNPIACLCYQQGGALGMVALKVLMTTFVIGAVYHVYKRKPHYSFFVIGLGCVIMAFTLGYSLHLGFLL